MSLFLSSCTIHAKMTKKCKLPKSKLQLASKVTASGPKAPVSPIPPNHRAILSLRRECRILHLESQLQRFSLKGLRPTFQRTIGAMVPSHC